MRGKTTTLTIALALVLVLWVPVSQSGNDVGKEIAVSPKGYENANSVHNLDTDEYFLTIQSAIDDPDTLNGHTLEVSNGTYYENVNVNKVLTIVGEDRNTTIIDGSNTGDVVRISADGTILTGFTITNGADSLGMAGVELTWAANCIISGNNISNNNWNGINVYMGSDNSIIENNLIHNNTELGIDLGSNVRISDNHIFNNGRRGIHIGMNEVNNKIENNSIYSNGWDGICFGGTHENKIVNNSVFSNLLYGIRFGGNYASNNTINNNEIYSNGFGFEWGNGVFIWASINNSIIQNDIYSNNNNGIAIGSLSNYNNISDNFINNNSIGIGFITNNLHNTTIENNTISYNNVGINLEIAYNNLIINNIVSNNENFGINLTSSNSNSIYHNNLINNVNQAQDDTGTNYWNNGYPSGGNYWSDYTGVDYNSTPTQDIPPSDGIGDTPYTNIGGGAGAIDQYPLMSPFEHVEYDVSLQEGWNLISLPTRQLNWSIDSVLESIAGKWDCIQTYNSSDSNWKSNNINRPASLNDLIEMNHLQAYWINITQPGVTMIVKGDLFNSSLSIPLKAGWNLVGYPSLSPVDIATALAGTGYDLPIEGFNATAPYRISPLTNSYMMKPGEGYWVHVPADTTWVVDW